MYIYIYMCVCICIYVYIYTIVIGPKKRKYARSSVYYTKRHGLLVSLFDEIAVCVSKSMNRVTESRLSVTIYHTEILTIVQDMKFTKYGIILDSPDCAKSTKSAILMSDLQKNSMPILVTPDTY